MSRVVLAAADARSVIDRVSDPRLIEHGRLHILSLEAIRERMGPRWALRGEGVWTFLERQFGRDFSPAEQLTRLDDTHFLLVQPSADRHTAEGKAIRLLRDVLEFFLGASRMADIRIGVVTKVDADGISHSPLELPDDLDQVRLPDTGRLDSPPAEPLEQDAAAPQPSTAAGLPWGRPLEVQGGLSRFRFLRGELSHDVVFMLEPLWSVHTRAIVSYRLRPLVLTEHGDRVPTGGLRVQDLIRLDAIVLAEARRRLSSAVQRFVLHVPIHHGTLGVVNGRQIITRVLDQMGEEARSSVIVSIEGLEAGAPQSRIAELTGILRGRCRGVVARAPDASTNVALWRGSRLSAVALDFSELDLSDAGLSNRLSAFAAQARPTANAIVAYALPSTSWLLTAWSSGFTHLGGDVLLERVGAEPAPVRFEAAEIWSSPAVSPADPEFA